MIKTPKKSAAIRSSSEGPPMNQLLEIVIQEKLAILDMFKKL